MTVPYLMDHSMKPTTLVDEFEHYSAWRDAVYVRVEVLRDYVHSSGELGYFQLQTRVYDRAGLPCKTCTAPIRRIVQGQRASYYCPVCQR